MWPVIKSVALENVLITPFFSDFLLCSYLGIILQDTRQGFTVILESWDFRIERSVSFTSHPGYADSYVVWAGGLPGTQSICCVLLQ